MTVLNPPYRAKVYRVKPQDFLPEMEVAACYINSNDHYLLLQCAKGKSQEFTWGMPAGKVEIGETPRQAVIREVREETDICLDDDSLQEVAALYVRYPHVDFVYHMFTQKCSQRPTVQLSKEHQDYRWVEVDDAFNFNFISGGKEALHQFLALEKERQA